MTGASLAAACLLAGAVAMLPNAGWPLIEADLPPAPDPNYCVDLDQAACEIPAVTPSAATPGKQRHVGLGSASRSLHGDVVGRPPLPAGRRRHTAAQAIRLVVTAYCATGSRNAAGHWPTLGTAAANAYPLGTRLHVEGYGDVVVEDRSAPGATDVDVYLGDGPACTRAAAAWGRRSLLIREPSSDRRPTDDH